MSSQTQVGCFSFKKQLLHIHIPHHNHIIFMFHQSVRQGIVFFTIIGVIAPTLPRIPTFCKTGLTRAHLPAKPLPVFSVKKGINPSGVSRFMFRELPHNPQKSINNDGIRMSNCIYYHCLAERNYSSPPFSFHIWSPSICRTDQSRRISCGKSVKREQIQ